MEWEIGRDYYLEQLIKRENNGLIKIVTGIRRCGKSFLLRTLFKKHLLENGVDGQKNRLRAKESIIFFWMKYSC